MAQDSHESLQQKRRQFLKLSAAGGLTAIAGCSGGGQQEMDEQATTESEETEVTETATPEEDVEYEKVRPLVWTGITRDFNLARFQAQSQVVEMLRKLGLEVELDVLKFSAVGKRFEEHDFDFMTMWMVMRPERLDPYIMLSGMHSQYSEPGGHNISEFRNDEYDTNVEQLKSTYEREKRAELTNTLTGILADKVPKIYNFHEGALAAANKEQFSGWKGAPSAWVFWNADALKQVSSNGQESLIMGTDKQITRNNIMGVSGDQNYQMMKLNYDPLMRLNIKGDPIKWAISELDVQDKTTIDVTIRDGMEWHDGEPFTAEDIKFTVDYLNEYQVPYIKKYYEGIESVESLGEKEARFNLKEPDSTFTGVSLTQFFMIPKHVWDGVTDEQGLEHPKNWGDPDMTGSGPFQISQLDPQSQVVYEVNHDHPMADYDFDQLIWKVYGSQSAAMGDLENNRISFVTHLAAPQYERATNMDNLLEYFQQGHGVSDWRMKNTEEPFHDLTFRRAVNHAVSDEDVINIALQGHGDPAHHRIAPANETFYNGDVPKYQGGLEQAKQMLREAGYRWDSSDGRLMRPKDRNKDNLGVQ